MTEINGRHTVSGIGGGAIAGEAVRAVQGTGRLRSSATRTGLEADPEKIEPDATEVARSETTSAREVRREAERVLADAVEPLPLSDAARAIAAEAATAVRRAKAAEQGATAEALGSRLADRQAAARAYADTAESVDRRR